MKIDKLKPGMTVFSVKKHKMGSTAMATASVYTETIKSVDVVAGTVVSSWNGNPPRVCHEKVWTKWRLKEPMLIRSLVGYARLATRAEIAKAKKPLT